MADERATTASPEATGRQALRPEPAVLRDVMSRFATGITVLTAPGERMHGMTANAFTSVSIDPPLVLCCVTRTARLHAAIAGAHRFGVSVLAADQEGLARYFSDSRRPAGAAQFDAVDWTPGPRTGAPLLDGALAWLECDLVADHGGGDHSIFVGEVSSVGFGTAQDALVFFDGRFRKSA